MKLTKEDLTRLFNLFLKEHILPRSVDHLPIFNSIEGGEMLTNRLYKVLRSKDLRHLNTGDKINVLEVYNLAKDFLELRKKVFIVGLNYWFTEFDLAALKCIYEREF